MLNKVNLGIHFSGVSSCCLLVPMQQNSTKPQVKSLNTAMAQLLSLIPWSQQECYSE